MMPQPQGEPKPTDTVVEVEVERLPADYDPKRDGEASPSDSPTAAKLRELNELLGPLVAGVLIDLLDAATPSPPMGLLLGWPLGYYIVRQLKCTPGTALKLGALVGVYCATPGTLFLPVATLVVAAVKVRRFLAKD